MKSVTIGALVMGGAAIIILIAVIASSYTRVNDDEACQIFYQDGNKIVTRERSGLVFVGPGQKKYCLSRATQHLYFSSEGNGLERAIGARSSEGLTLTLELDIEFRYDAERIGETVLRVGYEDPKARLLRTARAEVRNAASAFSVTEFLTGSREAIGLQIQTRLQHVLRDLDGIHVSVIQVNLLHIDVYEPFEERFQAVEDKRLAQLVAQENITLIELDEARLNETQHIEAIASRDRQLREAGSATVQAQLEQTRLVTEAQTLAEQDMIAAETDRTNRLIRAQTLLDETVARRTLLVQQVLREARANKTLAETMRQNMRVVAEGNKLRAMANRTRDVQLALINQTQAVEALVSRGIARTLDVFRTTASAQHEANVTRLRGIAHASDIRADTRARTAEFVALQNALNLTDRELASVLLYRGLGRRDPSQNLTLLMNYVKQPFMLELNEHSLPSPSSPLTSAPLPAVPQVSVDTSLNDGN